MDGKKLLSRDEFREGVFARDNRKCVICGSVGELDAHHILERRLFSDGGYRINNGASLCHAHHLEAEMTTLTVEAIREAIGITEAQKIIPEHLYADEVYDKWANSILPSGERMRGELFDDPNVQKILAQGNILSLFVKYVKYPRTYHLPWSPGITDDDRVIKSAEQFEGKRVIVTAKLDGENSSLYGDYIHARSRADKKHWSKSWVKNLHASIKGDIPEGWRICGENLFAKHSIKYSGLESYFYAFSIWNDKNRCLDWDDTLEWFDLFNLVPVPVLYDGLWDESLIRDIHRPVRDGNECEGYVVRLADGFHYRDFRSSVAKFVRAGHITSENHWFHGRASEQNELRAQ